MAYVQFFIFIALMNNKFGPFNDWCFIRCNWFYIRAWIFTLRASSLQTGTKSPCCRFYLFELPNLWTYLFDPMLLNKIDGVAFGINWFRREFMSFEMDRMNWNERKKEGNVSIIRIPSHRSMLVQFYFHRLCGMIKSITVQLQFLHMNLCPIYSQNTKKMI